MTPTRVFAVSGMTCDHCVRAVEDEVRRLPGVAAVEVALVPGGESLVTITGDQPLHPDAVAAAVSEAGYALLR